MQDEILSDLSNPYSAASEIAADRVDGETLAGVSSGAQRYTVEPALNLDGRTMYALRDIKTQRVVKFYRSGTVALTDAQFLNTVRPPLPLG